MTKQPTIKSPMSRLSDDTYRRFVIWAIIGAGILLYAHTLPFPFVWDGRGYILRNPLVKGFSYYDDLLQITQFAQLDDQLGIPADFVTNFALRPVTYLTFSLNHFFGGTNPVGYRSVNIALHIGNAVLIFLILERILKRAGDHTLDRFSIRTIPAATALIFLVHPLQTEPVIYIIQRFTVLATGCYLATLYLYLRSVTGRNRRLPYWGSVITLLLGMLTKEIVFTAPIVLLCLETIILKTDLRSAIKRLLPHLLCLPIIPVLLLIVSANQHNSPLSIEESINAINFYGYSVGHYAITQLCTIGTYLRLLLLPYGQNADYDYPLYTSLLQPKVIRSAVVIALTLGAAVFSYRRKPQDPRRSLLLFGTCFFFISIAVTSSFIPMAELIAERRTYLPSFGVFLAIICAIDLWRQQRTPFRQQAVIAGMAMWVVILGGVTHVRSQVWRSRVSFWEDAARKSPNKLRTILGLVGADYDKKQYGQAGNWLKKAIALYPDTPGLYPLLQELQYRQGKYAASIESGVHALSRKESSPKIYYLLGRAYPYVGLNDDAERALNYALALQPDYPDARLALADIFVAEKRYDEALELYRAALGRAPGNTGIVTRIRELESLLRIVDN